MTDIVLKYGDNGEEVKMLQRALNTMLKLRLTPDGGFGKLTEEAVRSYQSMHALSVTGIYTGQMAEKIGSFIDQKYLRTKDIAVAADKANIPPSMLMAFREVEARGDGFLPDGRPIILFERHKFYAQLTRISGKMQADAIYAIAPDVCNPQKGGYKGQEAEYPRLEKAQSYNKVAALNSASWGMFQIMGFNSALCGYPNVQDFVNANHNSEKDQLACVVSFIQKQPELLMAVRQRNYLRTAVLYNGPAQQGYDVKLAEADRKYVKMGY